ncbi:MAG: NirD/YgiW/YdeI family stress tolerance protein [Alphaproteobacteria bacterium]|nr:NirD/YgiW/YdeI family stress tolerance protein [Alphaproteobacteria bacterium]
MKKIILTCLAIAGLIFSGSDAFAGDHMAKNHSTDKPISKVSSVQNMPDDSMVYLQGYITQNLGDEMYVFQDDSGTMNIEIDDDLMTGNTIAPTTVVWVAAEVNKDGDVTSLEAEEIQFMPEMTTTGNTDMSK